jgi:hypothetical protein
MEPVKGGMLAAAESPVNHGVKAYDPDNVYRLLGHTLRRYERVG